MKRSDFIEDCNSLSQLEHIDYEYELYVFEEYEIIDNERWKEDVAYRVENWDSNDWYSLREFLNECYDHDEYDYYRSNYDYELYESGIDESWAGDLVEEVKQTILERMDNDDLWDEEDDEDDEIQLSQELVDFQNCGFSEMQARDKVIVEDWKYPWESHNGEQGEILAIASKNSEIRYKNGDCLWRPNESIKKVPDREISTNDINLGDVFFSARGIAELNNLARLEREQEKKEEAEQFGKEILELELPF